MSILKTGTIVLGQEQDSIGGGFAANQAFYGHLSMVRVYGSALLAATISDLSKLINEPTIAKFSQFQLLGGVTTVATDVVSISDLNTLYSQGFAVPIVDVGLSPQLFYFHTCTTVGCSHSTAVGSTAPPCLDSDSFIQDGACWLKKCASTNGTMKNSVAMMCQCGTIHCTADTGLYCAAERNKCYQERKTLGYYSV